jgi:hypothetical protein
VQCESLFIFFKTDFLEEVDDWRVVQHNFFDPRIALLEYPELEFIRVGYDVLDYF